MANDEYRSLSKKSLAKFLDGGCCEAFPQFLKEHQELIMCFRGNSGDAAVIYYNNHQVFNISNIGYVRVSFNHARYCKDWEKIGAFLIGKGFQRNKRSELGAPKIVVKNGSKSASIGILSRPPKPELSLEDLEEIYGVIKPMMDSYFDAYRNEEDAIDRFWLALYPEERRRNARAQREKRSQQMLFIGMKCVLDGYFAYDLEYSEPEGKRKEETNEPDMLAVRFDSAGKPAALVFVEVKSTRGALGGDSGLDEHIERMREYHSKGNGKLFKTRCEEACRTLNQYRCLNLYPQITQEYKETGFQNLAFENMLIFTDEVVDHEVEAGWKPAPLPLPGVKAYTCTIT